MNTCPDLLAALLQRRRDLELDAVAVKSRIEEIAELIDMIERPQRKRGRPPGPRRLVEVATDSGIATHTPDTDDELPLQSDAPGA
jgi:hypothetical protein